MVATLESFALTSYKFEVGYDQKIQIHLESDKYNYCPTYAPVSSWKKNGLRKIHDAEFPH